MIVRKPWSWSNTYIILVFSPIFSFMVSSHLLWSIIHFLSWCSTNQFDKSIFCFFSHIFCFFCKVDQVLIIKFLFLEKSSSHLVGFNFFRICRPGNISGKFYVWQYTRIILRSKYTKWDLIGSLQFEYTIEKYFALLQDL